MSYFDVPLNLPHAGTVARRIAARLEAHAAGRDGRDERALELAEALVELLTVWELRVEEALSLGRQLVDEIEGLSRGEDRLGQHVRNLFECLGHGREGAQISLRAGENPQSLMRPVPGSVEAPSAGPEALSPAGPFRGARRGRAAP